MRTLVRKSRPSSALVRAQLRDDAGLTHSSILGNIAKPQLDDCARNAAVPLTRVRISSNRGTTCALPLAKGEGFLEERFLSERNSPIELYF
jgi:hypothetical protein